jgi:endonuclease V-like protein UPF0215 family
MDLNSLFNKNTRILAFDDSPFSRDDLSCSLIGVIMRKDLYLESIVKRQITVDGMDVTEKILEAIEEKGSGIGVIMIKGITFAGFNILDIRTVSEKTHIPVINVLDHEPNIENIKAALKKHFPDWQLRFDLFNRKFTKFGSILVQCEGIEEEIAYKFIRQTTVNGLIPEPLRLADIIARIC